MTQAVVNYVVYGTPESNSILRTKSKLLNFPLSKEDLEDIKILETKYDAEENCSGLAAPQIGITKKILVFATPSDAALKKFRPDWTQSMPKTIWINPNYRGIEEEGFHEDYEACFSVGEVAGLVQRYKKIHYEAYDIHGELHKGLAEGFLARIIQHEIDHLEGILFIDRSIPGTVMFLAAYREKRRAALAAESQTST
jgi:peptide deformylase